jgi:hypothetical protein
MMESVPGIMVAAPTPWMMRKKMSCSMFCASPHANEAAMKITRPMRYTRRRPKMSPMRPEAIGKTAVAST